MGLFLLGKISFIYIYTFTFLRINDPVICSLNDHRLPYYHILLVEFHIMDKDMPYSVKKNESFRHYSEQNTYAVIAHHPLFYISLKLPNFSLLMIIFINFQAHGLGSNAKT